MNPTRTLPLLALLLAGTLFFAGCGGDGDSDSGDDWSGKTIQLGSIFSTSGDGDAFGPQQLQGAKLAIDEINADGGIEGAKIALTQRNDESVPATSTAAMVNLIEQDEVLAVLGPTFSNSAAEADPAANDRQTPVLAVSNTGPGIVGDCPYPCEYIFRDSLGEADAIPANIDNLVADRKPATALVIHPADDPFGASTAEIAVKAFEENDVKVVGVKQAPPFGINGLQDVRADAVMITASSGAVAAQLIRQVQLLGHRGPILGGNAFNSSLAARQSGPTGKGAQSAAAWYAGNDSEENQEFVTDYRAKYGQEPDQFAAQAYAGVELLAEAADDADLSFDDIAADREAIKASLEGVHEETPLGDFRFTKDHDVIQPVWIVQMNGKGGYKLVEEVSPE